MMTWLISLLIATYAIEGWVDLKRGDPDLIKASWLRIFVAVGMISIMMWAEYA